MKPFLDHSMKKSSHNQLWKQFLHAIGVPHKPKTPVFHKEPKKSVYKQEKEYLERLFEHHEHHSPFSKLEHLVDAVIPYLILLLLVLIIGEFAFKEFFHQYEHQIEILDKFIIIVFIIDLVVKYLRVRQVPMIIKHFWIDILAVFPFYLFFRFGETFLGLSQAAVGDTQMIVHESVEIEKEAARIAQETEKAGRAIKEAGKTSRLIREGEEISKVAAREVRGLQGLRAVRMTRFARMFRLAQRIPRLIKGFHYFEKPNLQATNMVPAVFKHYIKKEKKK